MKNVLSTYLQEYIEIRLKKEYAFGLAQDFVAKLLALPPEDRYELLPLFKQIENESFEDAIEIPNLDYETLEKGKAEWESSSKTPSVKKKEKKSEVEDDFNKVLFYFFSKFEFFFIKNKGYFVFRLDNSNSKTKIIVLYDESYSKHPEISSFDIKDENLEIEKHQLHDFLELAGKKTEIVMENYLCILLITSNLRNNEIVVPDVEKLLGMFSNSNYFSLKKIPVTVANEYDIKESKDGVEIIKNYSDKIFNNRALSFEEELIIKKLFDGNEMILDYKFLKSGNSGSKVIEIQPLRGNYPEMGRFVVKFDAINSERKIKKEKKLFKQFITDLIIPSSYTAEFDETNTHEAIRYNYASSDSKEDSYPFSKLIDECISGEYNHEFTIEKVIEELFTCSPYQKWNTSKFGVTHPVKTLYSDYLNSEGKIRKAISLIKGIDEAKLDAEEVVSNYKIIKEYSLKTYKKICHGDLHSENFFKDKQGVYLIDFGWTNQHHSLIDHATLECSLKFKHLPIYTPVDDLISFETELLSINSFSKSFDLSFIKRPSVLEIAKLITQIREDAKEYMIDKTSPLEYLISLFIINFRQIQYPDLNQAYALATAEVLSKKIIELIM